MVSPSDNAQSPEFSCWTNTPLKAVWSPKVFAQPDVNPDVSLINEDPA
jgi:hypothetical protein